jgi:hypothetical protein
VKSLSSIGRRWQSIRIWSNAKSLLTNNMLCRIQQKCITVGRKSSSKDNIVPIYLNLNFSISNPLSTLILMDECFRLNHTSSVERDNLMRLFLNDMIHQLKSGYSWYQEDCELSGKHEIYLHNIV